MRRPIRILAADCRGVSALEFAIVAGVFLVLSFGVIELGLLWWTKNALQATAALTARCAGLGACQCAAGACTPAQFAVETASAWVVTGVIGTADVTISSNVACNGTPQTTHTSAAITSRFWASDSLPPPFPSTAISVSACFPTSTFN